MDIRAYIRIIDLTIEVAGLFLNLAGNFSFTFALHPHLLFWNLSWYGYYLLWWSKVHIAFFFFGLVVYWMQAKSFI